MKELPTALETPYDALNMQGMIVVAPPQTGSWRR